MFDIKSAAREAAEPEAERIMPFTGGPLDGGRETSHRRFADGAEFIAGRIPDRDDLVDVVERNAVIPTSDAEAVADAVLALIAERMRGNGEG